MRALSPSRQTFQLPAGGHPFLSCMLVHAASGHGSSTASHELLNPAWTCPSCSCSPAGMGLEARCCWRPRLDPVCGNKPRTTTVHSAWGSGEPELKNFLLCLRCIRLGRWLSPAGILHAPPDVIPSSRPPAKVQEGGENSQSHLYSCCPTSPGGKTVPHLPQALWLLPHCLPSPAQLSPQPASSHGAADGQRRKKSSIRLPVHQAHVAGGPHWVSAPYLTGDEVSRERKGKNQKPSPKSYLRLYF